MKQVAIKFGDELLPFNLPDDADVFSMVTPQPLANPAEAVEQALGQSIGAPSLTELITAKFKEKPDFKTVIVISDNTRPVPYRGDQGILWPIIQKLLEQQVAKENILILVATGTHRALTGDELREMLDPRVFETGIKVKNHDCHDLDNLVFLGETRRGSRVLINRDYVEADLKILTGLVESHFMAGVSGGRKSVCPGLIGEESTFVFHSAPLLASPLACDLSLEGNPCHDEALEVAKKAGVDYIVNVTLDHHFQLTGVFAGDLEKAHYRAVDRVKEYVAIPVQQEYDLVITNAGFVGINHYQAAKAGVAAIPVLKPGGKLIMAANNTDSDPIGSLNYRTVLQLLKIIGVKAFNRLLLSPDWAFIPEQWQVQMWSKLFSKIPLENLIYYSPQLRKEDYRFLPGADGNLFLPEAVRYKGSFQTIATFLESAVAQTVADFQREGKSKVSIACLIDGPYGIPVKL